jgi:YD repeat-containing protein
MNARHTSALLWLTVSVGCLLLPVVAGRSASDPRYFGQQHPAGTETTWTYDPEGNLVQVDTTYDDKGRVTVKKEYDKNKKLRKRTTYKYLKDFKEADTSTTNYRPDGKTEESTTSVDHDKDGNPSITVTTNYDINGKEIGGTKRERDTKTGKDRCYNWNPSKQVYEEGECPKKPWVSSVGDDAKVETGGGLIKVNFKVEGGSVIVNLPDDMMAGDKISGTVMEEPDHLSPIDDSSLFVRQMYLDFLHREPGPGASQFWISIVGEKGSAPPPVKFNVDIPENQPIPIILRDKDGNPIGSITLPQIFVPPPSTGSTAPSSFHLPTMGQQGRLIEIVGPFDGNSSNTKLMYGPKGSSIQDFEKNTENVTGGFGLLQPLAESPRKCVLPAPVNVSGPIELFVKDGQAQTTVPYRNVGVNLSAPKTNLLQGERTTLTIQVTGLQGITKAVPLTLDSKGVIAMEGGMFQPLMIQPSEVGADGRYTTTRGITGVQTGAWTSTATVVTQPFNIVLRDPDPPQTVLINSFTGDYVFCGSGLKLNGTGQIKRQGCMLTLTDNKPDREVQGNFDSCVPVDNGKFSIFYSAGVRVDIHVTVTDPQPPLKKKVYFNPLGRPAPPIQDVSAFATCP